MKNLNKQTETKLGYDSIRELLEGRAATEQGKELCLAMRPFQHSNQLAAELDRVEECRDLLRFDESFSLDYSGNVTELLNYAAVPGNWLQVRDFFSFLRWLRMVREITTFFSSRQVKYPALAALVGKLNVNKALLKGIETVVDDRGNIKDNASPKLQSLRKEQAVQSADLRKSMQSILRHAVEKGWSDAAELTIRNDRLVIPIKADFKGHIKGFVHDVSQSGQTIFLEPSSALEANNRIRQLVLEEHNEIVRILMVLTAQVREDLPNLRRFAEVVAQLDFIRAKARLAVDLDAYKPRFEPENKTLLLVKGRHPLLVLKQGMEKGKVVPLSIHLSPEQRIILVSGPNAGGKSVTLKTVGLLVLMFQSGLLIPADESSEFPWFTDIFVDIGDEQSIQSDLSTYTSHLKNMRDMLAHLKAGKLFLMDEFGSGTDPRLGGAIAEAFLERFVDSGAYGVVTTHYGNLKDFADRKPGIVNAAMQFDPNTLSPTFRIDVGIPGRSYAFEIAQNVGVSTDLLEDARGRIEGNQLETEDLLLKLEEQKHELEKLLQENRRINEELAVILKRNQELTQRTKEEEARILKEAHQKAQYLIDSANAKIEKTIREIRESQAEKERTKTLRRELAQMLPALPAEEAEEIAEESAIGSTEEGNEVELSPETLPGAVIAVGDWVLLKDSNSYGQLLDLQDKRAVVSLGDMRVTVKTKHLVKIKPPKDGRAPLVRRAGAMVAKKSNVSLELSVKGFRVEQALPQVQRFIDDAILAGMPEVRILHGKGTGALREAIREYLATLPEVRRTEDAPVDQGGAGWTVVHLEV
jgi:DNA mismatch repair protein MutS2